jgi:hypothetical protein
MRTLLDDLRADGYNYNGGNAFDMINGIVSGRFPSMVACAESHKED